MRYRYNTFSKRFKAGIIDGIVLLPIGLLDLLILNPSRNLGIVITWVIISYSSFFVYSIYFHWKSGQTIGKRAMRVRVMDISEGKGLTLKQAFLRDSVYVILQIIGLILIIINIVQMGAYSEIGIEPYSSYWAYSSLIWFLVEIITMLTNDKRRALHDMIANTVVINT